MPMNIRLTSFTSTLCSLLVIAGLALTGCSPKPVSVMSVSGPDSLDVDESGEFTAEVARENQPNEAPGLPVEYDWDFGDGTSDSGTIDNENNLGASASHSFSEGGQYTVEFNATNREGQSQDSGTTTVMVVAPPEIVTINASSTNVETGQSVDFSANVEGTAPFDFEWEFGDGSSSMQESPSHSYGSEGTMSVSLTVSNRAGEDTRSLSINVEPAEGPCDRLTELNTVNFDFDRSNLDDEAQGLLDENVSALSGCPNVNVRVDAYTDHVGTDQYNLRLSERRARSVEDYYTQSGIVGSRLNTRGLGKAPEPCMKEDPGPGCRRNRRAESIPLH